MSAGPDVEHLNRVLRHGGVALVPTDTVYGLACSLDVEGAVDRLYEVKGRDRGKPCQVLVYRPDLVEEAVAATDEAARSVIRAVTPGTVTCIIGDPSGRFAEASGSAVGSVGLRVPRMPDAFAAVNQLLVATSANDPGGPSPAAVDEVPAGIRARVDLVVDVGPLPGTASSVLDLTRMPDGVRIVRAGPDMDGLFDVLDGLGVRVRR